ncbi:hypothetical protein HAX54_010068 [Datura stramonium]|uniref:Uncharacterized protein n=1 Tax=Datura stramonium TaxID=4076 RepID=A0ABS8WXS3_DATST|nr:hypothetical protein [Datura stramonium]
MPRCSSQRLVDRVVGLPREIKPEPSHGPIRRTIVSHNGPLYWLMGKVTSSVNKKQQEIAARKEIAKRRQLRDESELDRSSGLEKGNDDAEESRDDDTNAEESDDSVAIETNEQVEDSEPGTTPEIRLKRWFLQGYRDVYFAG